MLFSALATPSIFANQPSLDAINAVTDLRILPQFLWTADVEYYWLSRLKDEDTPSFEEYAARWNWETTSIAMGLKANGLHESDAGSEVPFGVFDRDIRVL
jgi:hypothetical protein